ncbi:MAG: thiol reductase thioredoxin [Bacteroidetes bacterium]|nr:thiol reductase thioredoxin [Bacteroidota bacterium]
MEPRSIIDAEFEQQVLNAEELVIVNFWASWSRPSRVVFPILEVISDRYNGELTIVMLNVDKNKQLVKEFVIERIPTLLFFAGGKVVDKAEGISSVKYLEAQIQRLLPVLV